MMKTTKTTIKLSFFVLILFVSHIKSDDNLPKFSDTTHELIGYCVPYHGKICSSYITYDQVWYSNVSVDLQLNVILKICVRTIVVTHARMLLFN